MPALIVPLPVKRFPNKLAPEVPDNVLRNRPFCYFASFLIVSLTPFINNSDSSRDLTIFIISFISSLEINSVVKPDPNISWWIIAPVADAAAVNPNGIKTLLANGLSIFPIKFNPVLNNGPISLFKNSSDFTMLCSWVDDIFILAEELFGKPLQSFETNVLVNDYLRGKLSSSFKISDKTW